MHKAYFRNKNVSETNQPLEINFTESEYTAIIALVSDEFVNDSNYGKFLDDIFDKCEIEKNKRRVYPVAISKSAYNVSTKFSAINFIRVDRSKLACNKEEIISINSQIKTPILHELCRLLMNMKKATERTRKRKTGRPATGVPRSSAPARTKACCRSSWIMPDGSSRSPSPRR